MLDHCRIGWHPREGTINHRNHVVGAVIGVWLSGERSTWQSRLIRWRLPLIRHTLEPSEDTMWVSGLLHMSADGHRARLNGYVVLAGTLGAKFT